MTRPVAIVTGAGSGIGAAIARRLAEGGNHVTVTDIDQSAATEVAHAILAQGGSADADVLDVSDERQWRNVVVRTAAANGSVGILIGNAALTAPALMAADLGVLDPPLSLWDDVMDVNLRGNALGARAVLPGMIANGGGAIVFTSSISAMRPGAARTAYSVSKAGLEGLSRAIATRYGRSGVRCNCIAPGFVDTEALTGGHIAADRLRALADSSALGRLGRADEIAAAAAFLTSPAASYITGQTLVVDGGVSMHLRV
ncbi:MAG: SDR family NAD(P)-dependent oxidoreductase [Hyphomonadaceae bacterium]|nr:SDR family NAD(P)-dependent oxidoreductase [Hyphomonadaceae bacterium]